MKEDELSIIIPIYNGMDTIERCIKSINSNEAEIIIVDDGSYDDTLKICREYEKKHKNIKVLHQDNKGAAMARILGVENAAGKYIMFLDCDDCYENNTIQKILETVEKYEQPDLIRFRYRKMLDNTNQNEYFSEKEKIVQKSEFKNEVYPMFLNGYMLNSVSTNCVKKEILNKILITNEDKNIRYGEDLIYNLEIFSKINNAVFLQDILYKYCYRPDSATNTQNKGRLLIILDDVIEIYTKLYEYLIKWDMYNEKNLKIVSNRVKYEIKKILKRLNLNLD